MASDAIPTSRILYPDPSPAAVAALEELKTQLAQTDLDSSAPFKEFVLNNDMELHRFLRARQLDVPKALQMLTEHAAWFDGMRPDLIRAADVEPEARTGKGRVPGVDMVGHALGLPLTWAAWPGYAAARLKRGKHLGCD